jgi:subtilisin family serine protease
MDLSYLPPDDHIIEIGELSVLSDRVDWGIIDFDVPKMWEKNQGENIIVMVCDTGITSHSDLDENILFDSAKSFIEGEDYKDLQGHGTSVAGVIAAKETNFGIIGVAPKTKIIPVKSLSNNGSGSTKSLEDSLKYAIEIKPDIVNLSLGSQFPQGQHFYELVLELYKLNIPVVCAMGNYGYNYSCFPANYPETIAITSYKKGRIISEFSSRSSNADFALPGENILTTSLDNKFSIVNGTSFAAPFLSGLLAIILSEAKNKNIVYTVDQIKSILVDSCEDYGPEGRDPYFGYGIIDVTKLNNVF